MTARDGSSELVADPAVVLTGAVRDLRRRVGPVAWAVLEDVVLDAAFEPGGCLVATTNVRRVADQVGVSKDSAAAALTRLARLGLVERRPVLRAARGRFGRSVYLVRLDAAEGVTRLDSQLETRLCGSSDAGGPAEVETGDHAVAATGARPPAQRRRRRARVEQSSLFDDQQVTDR